MRTLIILNPTAGSAERKAEVLRDWAADKPEVTIIQSEGGGGARSLAEQGVAGGYELIVAAGGDGTIHEVVQGIAPAGDRVILGVLPFGTGNDLSRTLAIPDDPIEAISILSNGVVKPMDLFRVEMAGEVRYGVNVAAGGFSGQVDELLTDDIKSTWGPLAYVRGALGALPDLKAYDTRVAWEGGEIERIEAFNIVVANGQTCGSGMRVAPKADLCDGLLDVVIVRHGSLLELARIGAQLITGDYTEGDGVTLRRARRLWVASKPGMWFNVDGELIGNEPVSFEVVPSALRVLFPPPPPPVEDEIPVVPEAFLG